MFKKVFLDTTLNKNAMVINTRSQSRNIQDRIFVIEYEKWDEHVI